MKTNRLLASRVWILLSLVGSLMARPAAADSLTLLWDASVEPVSGYVVYSGTQSGSYSERHDVGDTTTFTMTAVPGQRYCFAVSAYVDPSVEGATSAEVCGFSNRFPTLVNPGNQTSIVGQAVTLQLVGSDPDGRSVTYSASGLPPGLSLMQSAGFISGAGTAAGSYPVVASVWDGVLSASQSFTWVISTTTPPSDTTTSLVLTNTVLSRGKWTRIGLNWSAVPGQSADVYRNGTRVTTTSNDGSYTDSLSGSGYVSYRICIKDTGLCSNTVGVSY